MKRNRRTHKQIYDEAYAAGHARGVCTGVSEFIKQQEDKKIEAQTRLLNAAGQFQETITRLLMSTKKDL